MTTMTMSTMVMMMAATWCCQCKHGHVLITMFFFMITCSLNKIITCTDSRALHCYHSYNFKTYSKYILFLNIVAIYNTGAFENDSLEGTYNMYLYCSFFKIREKSNQNEKKNERKTKLEGKNLIKGGLWRFDFSSVSDLE